MKHPSPQTSSRHHREKDYGLKSRLKYWLLTTVACIMSKTVSPNPRYFSATPRTVGSDMVSKLGLEDYKTHVILRLLS